MDDDGDDACFVPSDWKDDGDGGRSGGATAASRARGKTAKRAREVERSQNQVGAAGRTSYCCVRSCVSSAFSSSVRRHCSFFICRVTFIL